MVFNSQVVVDQLCGILDEMKQLRMLSKAVENRTIDVYFVTIPEEGGTREFAIGITKINFRNGEITNPDGTTETLQRRLDLAQDKNFMHSVSVHANQDVKLRLNTSGQWTINADFLFQLPFVTYYNLEITCTETTNISLFACTNPQATLGNFKVTDMTTIEQESVIGDTTEDQSWDTVVSLKNNMNRIRHQIVAITGEAWGTVSTSIDTLLAKFDATTGHDHDGTDSKKVDASDVVNTPSGDIAATNVQSAINEIDTEKAPITSPVFTGQIRRSTSNGFVAHAGGGQADASLMSADINEISVCATTGDSVKLKNGDRGKKIVVINNGAAALDVFPISGDYIDNVLNTAVSVPAGYTAIFNCYTSDRWKSHIAGIVNTASVDAAGAAMNSDKDVANGIAGLDNNSFLNFSAAYPFFEDYSNHLGVIDNFLNSGSSGVGTVSEDATNHEIDLDSSTMTSGGGTAYISTKTIYSLSSVPLIVNYIVQNIAGGAGGDRRTLIGFDNNIAGNSTYNCALFEHDGSNVWKAVSGNSSNIEFTSPLTINNGDLLTIFLLNDKALFYINGVLVATHTAYLPAVDVGCGAYVRASTPGNVTSARTISIDMISFKKAV